MSRDQDTFGHALRDDRTLRSSQKLVAVMLFLRWPNIRPSLLLLAEDCRLAKSAVWEALHGRTRYGKLEYEGLIDRGWVKIKSKGRTDHHATVYELTVPELCRHAVQSPGNTVPPDDTVTDDCTATRHSTVPPRDTVTVSPRDTQDVQVEEDKKEQPTSSSSMPGSRGDSAEESGGRHDDDDESSRADTSGQPSSSMPSSNGHRPRRPVPTSESPGGYLPDPTFDSIRDFLRPYGVPLNPKVIRESLAGWRKSHGDLVDTLWSNPLAAEYFTMLMEGKYNPPGYLLKNAIPQMLDDPYVIEKLAERAAERHDDDEPEPEDPRSDEEKCLELIPLVAKEYGISEEKARDITMSVQGGWAERLRVTRSRTRT